MQETSFLEYVKQGQSAEERYARVKERYPRIRNVLRRGTPFLRPTIRRNLEIMIKEGIIPGSDKYAGQKDGITEMNKEVAAGLVARRVVTVKENSGTIVKHRRYLFKDEEAYQLTLLLIDNGLCPELYRH